MLADHLQKTVALTGFTVVGLLSDPDVFRFLFLICAALFYGGVIHTVRRYRTAQPDLTPKQRKRFVMGALAGGSTLVAGVVVNMLYRQDMDVAPGTPIAFVGLVVILATLWGLLWYARPPRDRR